MKRLSGGIVCMALLLGACGGEQNTSTPPVQPEVLQSAAPQEASMVTENTNNSGEATDWSDLLCDVVGECPEGDTSNSWSGYAKDIPASLQGSITKIVGGKAPTPEEQDKLDSQELESLKSVYMLNNATAFGYPLDKVEIITAYEASATILYFKNNDFMALKPKIKVLEDKEDKEEGEGCGSSWEFDENKHTLTQVSGC